jgi:hypothetical protein|tara:strand:- start:239 stop:1135 length:897 start_codon:yes stop_codon:yes gene_type:complete
MSENTTNETQIVQDDNLMSALNNFNAGVTGSQETEVEVEEPTTEESAQLSEEEITEQEEAVEEVRKWLIDNKFEDSEEGRQKLADAYKNIQSAKDKAEGELREKSSKYEKLDKLDEWLKSNPKIVEMLQNEAEKQEANGPPEKPEDYDLMEESVQGSPSNLWRKEYDEWLIEQGAKKAMQQFETVRQKENAVKAQEAEINELKSLGMTDDEIKSFYGFMQSPDNVTTSNMVKVWKVLSGKEKENAETSSDNKTKDSKKVLEMEKVQSGASVEGKPTPAKKPQDKELDDFMKGIMQFSK